MDLIWCIGVHSTEPHTEIIPCINYRWHTMINYTMLPLEAALYYRTTYGPTHCVYSKTKNPVPMQ